MPDSPSPGSSASLHQAFDAVRFGERRTLNLRTQLPTPSQAVEQCEKWLRQKQVEGVDEVLVITGRGNRSLESFSPVREAVAALLPSLRRRNIVMGFAEHTAGSFVVRLAPVRALFDAPKRRREKPTPTGVHVLPELKALEPETHALLRELARMELESLGVRAITDAVLGEEMLRQFAALAPAAAPGIDAEASLQQALMRAIEEFHQ